MNKEIENWNAITDVQDYIGGIIFHTAVQSQKLTFVFVVLFPVFVTIGHGQVSVRPQLGTWSPATAWYGETIRTSGTWSIQTWSSWCSCVSLPTSLTFLTSLSLAKYSLNFSTFEKLLIIDIFGFLLCNYNIYLFARRPLFSSIALHARNTINTWQTIVSWLPFHARHSWHTL